MNNTENQLDWLSSIAQLTKEKPEFVKEVLEKYNIRQSPSIGKPRRLNIKEIRFSGEKSGNYTDLFEFSFQNLNPGLWGLVSEGNLKGKTSILEIVRWLLRGKSSRNFQEGVKNWIKEASLEFLIDNIKYKVYLNQNNEKISGQLVEIPYTSQELVISSFVSEDEFEACMSEFMMKQLSLDFITAWRENSSQGEIGKFVRHDWSAISGVLFISTNYTAIFGDVCEDGLPNRLMNMYLGLPWIPTLATLNTTKRKIEAQVKVVSNQTTLKYNQQQERRASIEEELKKYRLKLEQIPSDTDVRNTLNKKNELHSNAMQKLRMLNIELNSITQKSNELNKALAQTKKDCNISITAGSRPEEK